MKMHQMFLHAKLRCLKRSKQQMYHLQLLRSTISISLDISLIIRYAFISSDPESTYLLSKQVHAQILCSRNLHVFLNSTLEPFQCKKSAPSMSNCQVCLPVPGMCIEGNVKKLKQNIWTFWFMLIKNWKSSKIIDENGKWNWLLKLEMHGHREKGETISNTDVSLDRFWCTCVTGIDYLVLICY